jgi:hypothetical protein
LRPLRSYLERVCESVDKDYSEIGDRISIGNLTGEDAANAFYEPMVVEEIALRSIYHELNALIESELQCLVVIPLSKRNRIQNREEKRLAWDLKRGELTKLIERYYEIRIDRLPEFERVEEIRQTVNAWKHRQGHKDPRRTAVITIDEKHQIEREKAFASIDAVRSFLLALWAEARTLPEEP